MPLLKIMKSMATNDNRHFYARSQRKRILRWAGAEGGLEFAIGAEMIQAVVDVLGIGLDRCGDFAGGFGRCGDVSAHGIEGIEESGCSFFPCFDAGLVVGVDVD